MSSTEVFVSSKPPPILSRPASRRRSVVVGASVLGFVCAAMALTLFAFDPARYSFYPFCVFHRTTGMLCPGCGGLRAVHQLLHGHFVEAFRFNALFIASLLFLGCYGVLRLRARLAKRPGPRLHVAWSVLALALVVLFGILRNFPFASNIGLAP
jgi:hypothetical protein